MQTITINGKDLLWLAGLLEGDGCFDQRKVHGESPAPRISIGLIDEDTIKKVSKIWGSSYYQTPPRKEKEKVIYKSMISGSKALHIMKLLQPYMGERRSLKILGLTQKMDIFLALKHPGPPLTKYKVKITGNYSEEALSNFYLSGLLEAEGSFLKGPPSSPNDPKISIQMSDKDIINKVANMWETGYTSWQRSGITKSGNPYKKMYCAICRGKKGLEVMRLLHPFLSKRRQQQIQDVFDSYDDKATKKGHLKRIKCDRDLAHKLHKDGLSDRAIAKELGVHHSTVQYALGRSRRLHN